MLKKIFLENLQNLLNFSRFTLRNWHNDFCSNKKKIFTITER